MTDLVTKENLDDQVYRILKKRILTLQFRLGDPISISQVAKDLGVSNTPVRQALSRLCDQGWVQHIPKSGYRIIMLSEADINEIYDIRKLLEAHALEETAKEVSSTAWKKLLTKMRKLKDQKKSSKRDELFRELDEQVHKLIMKKQSSRTLRRLFNAIFDVVLISQWMGVEIDRPLEEHILFLEQILNKNVDNAKQILIRHIDNAKRAALKRLDVYSRKNSGT